MRPTLRRGPSRPEKSGVTKPRSPVGVATAYPTGVLKHRAFRLRGNLSRNPKGCQLHKRSEITQWSGDPRAHLPWPCPYRNKARYPSAGTGWILNPAVKPTQRHPPTHNHVGGNPLGMSSKATEIHSLGITSGRKQSHSLGRLSGPRPFSAATASDVRNHSC